MGVRVAERVRVAIVGSGPAGLSAAAHAAALGLSHVLLEKTDHLSDTIYKYQKGKHVMATPASLVLRAGGDLDFAAGKREVVLGTWDEQAAARQVNVRYNAAVTAIEGERGAFTLKIGDGVCPQIESTEIKAFVAQTNLINFTFQIFRLKPFAV